MKRKRDPEFCLAVNPIDFMADLCDVFLSRLDKETEKIFVTEKSHPAGEMGVTCTIETKSREHYHGFRHGRVQAKVVKRNKGRGDSYAFLLRYNGENIVKIILDDESIVLSAIPRFTKLLHLFDRLLVDELNNNPSYTEGYGFKSVATRNRGNESRLAVIEDFFLNLVEQLLEVVPDERPANPDIVPYRAPVASDMAVPATI